MLRPSILACGVAIAVFAQPVSACENPSLPDIPGRNMGGPAVRQAAQLTMQAYFDAMDEYVSCIQAELTAAGGDDAPDMVKVALVQRNNLAVAEAQAVADWFEDRFGTTRAE